MSLLSSPLPPLPFTAQAHTLLELTKYQSCWRASDGKIKRGNFLQNWMEIGILFGIMSIMNLNLQNIITFGELVMEARSVRKHLKELG